MEKAFNADQEWQDYCKDYLAELKKVCKDMMGTSAYCRRELEMWEESDRSDALAETAFSTDPEEEIRENQGS